MDIIASKLSRRAQIGIEIFGVLFFLMPACLLIMYLSWPVFMDSYLSNEYSSNSGGLIRWPVKLLIPVGFALLALAGLSHLIKCVGFLAGAAATREREGAKSAEEELAEEIAREAGARSRRTERTEREGPLTMEFLIANLAPIMFATLIGFLLLGFPVAFALAANGILFGLVGMELGLLNSSLFQALPQRVFGIISNDTLLAVPFFTLMGLVLERSGMAEDLLETIGQLSARCARPGDRGRVRGRHAGRHDRRGVGLGDLDGPHLLPIMLRYGYDRRLASGIIAASGTLSQIIPPSLVLIILADQLGRSIGDIYRAAMVPGFILAGLYIVYIVIMSLLKPDSAPALPEEARRFQAPNGGRGGRSLLVLMAISAVSAYFLGLWVENNTAPLDERIVVALLFWGATAFVIALVNKALGLGLLSALAERVTFVMIPPLALIFLVLGTIFIGVATPTEGGAMGAVGAILMAVARRRLSLDLLRQAMDTTTKLSCFVVFILVGSTVFGLTFRAVNGDLWVEHLLTACPAGSGAS